jgi:hypothetical protein
MPHLDDTPPLERTLDLAISRELEKATAVGALLMLRLLAEAPRADPALRRQAYAWLFEQAQREELAAAERRRP